MAFKFRLEGILKLRKEEERDAEMYLGHLRRQEYEYQQTLQALYKNKEDWFSQYNQAVMSVDNNHYELMIERYLIVLEQNIRNQIRLVEDIQQKIDEAIEELKRRHQARKQIEHLKNKKEQEYYLDLKIKETRDVTEMNTLRFIFKHVHEEGNA